MRRKERGLAGRTNRKKGKRCVGLALAALCAGPGGPAAVCGRALLDLYDVPRLAGLEVPCLRSARVRGIHYRALGWMVGRENQIPSEGEGSSYVLECSLGSTERVTGRSGRARIEACSGPVARGSGRRKMGSGGLGSAAVRTDISAGRYAAHRAGKIRAANRKLRMVGPAGRLADAVGIVLGSGIRVGDFCSAAGLQSQRLGFLAGGPGKTRGNCGMDRAQRRWRKARLEQKHVGKQSIDKGTDRQTRAIRLRCRTADSACDGCSHSGAFDE